MIQVAVAKKRAIAARFLACVLPVVLSAVSAASASAATLTPKLVMTNPASTEAATASSLTPAVLGEAEPEDGIIEESAPVGGRTLLAPVTMTVTNPTKHPTFEIQVFDGAECPGAPIAAGTAAELEGAGIAVNVAADAKTTLSAVQVDSGTFERSSCSAPLYYWEGIVPPEGGSSSSSDGGGAGVTGSQGSSGSSSSGGSIGPGAPAGGRPAAPHIHTSPSDRANDMAPLVVGSAPGADTVAIYGNDDCSGTPLAKGPASQLSSGFEVAVAPNAATTFSAVAIAAQRSACSSPVTYTEDSTAPRTRITMGPGIKTRKRKAVFRFKDVTEDPPGTTFRCKVNKAQWKPCTSPFHLKHLKLGHYVLAIRATDLAGNPERKPVKRRFIVVPPAGR
jgi:hypothetical protein